ncbi:MAG: GerMN domain-containing protein [Oscillospiraceae bacterium]|nr:GerMN domain-containing protein [Oscillospiraceae bacterium]
MQRTKNTGKAIAVGLLLAVTGIVIFVSFFNNSREVNAVNETADLYFVDSELMMLIPNTYYLPEVSREKAAKKVISELINGRDDNSKIMRIMPKIKNGITVKVKNDTAYVDLSNEFVQAHTDNAHKEILTVYSIVDSLTSIDGIKKVRFTIGGKEQAKFKGNIDMREVFLPDYTV